MALIIFWVKRAYMKRKENLTMVTSKVISFENEKRQINDSATEVSADISSFAPRESFYAEG
jgi:hypothetical protein